MSWGFSRKNLSGYFIVAFFLKSAGIFRFLAINRHRQIGYFDIYKHRADFDRSLAFFCRQIYKFNGIYKPLSFGYNSSVIIKMLYRTSALRRCSALGGVNS